MSRVQFDHRFRQKNPSFVETGSCFDKTDTRSIKVRPGGHEALPQKELDISAFSFSKKTERKTPHAFVRKGTGAGGTLKPPRSMRPHQSFLTKILSLLLNVKNTFQHFQ